ncbi:hypothetical protein ACHAXT_000537 [Thalassiosira profunda]
MAAEQPPSAMKAEDLAPPLPLADPLAPGGLGSPGIPLALGVPVPMPLDGAAGLSRVPVAAAAADVLFGRGGLTNRHIGNLRYRDIISLHRSDYVRAVKTEKPNVARRIVKAIRTGPNPGRFLKKGDDGRWHQVNDKEAAWKASQALREKTRWSSMKHAEGEEEKAAAVVDATMGKVNVAEKANDKPVEKAAAKRKAAEVEVAKPAAMPALPSPVAAPAPAPKKARPAAPPRPKPQQPPPMPAPILAMPTQISHIVVPPVVTVGDRKVGANYMLPAAMNNDAATGVFPKEEDVLFGRGGRTNHHPGNHRLREIVNRYRAVYHHARKNDKPKVSKLIVGALRSANPPSRFLRMNDDTALWEDVGDKRAAEKVSQTLREKEKGSKSEAPAEEGEAPMAQAPGTALLSPPVPGLQVGAEIDI